MKTFAFCLAATLYATPAAAQSVASSPPMYEASSAATSLDNQRLADVPGLKRQANRWEAGFLTLSAIDAAQTCDAVGRGVAREANPLFGPSPKCGTVVAAKVAGGVLHYLLFRHTLERNPRAARLLGQLSFGLQGAVVGLNFRYTFKSR
jgi:hypothetical protein